MALTSITRDFVVKAGALVEGTSFATTSTGQTGTLQVNGGAAIAKNLVVGTTATIWGNQTNYGTLNVTGQSTLANLSAQVTTATNLTVTGPSLFQGQTLFTGAVNTFSGALFVTGTNILTVGTGATNLGGTLGVAGVTSITNNTTAGYSGNTGALVVTGGILTQDNLVVKSTAYNTTTNTANAIYTPGGIYSDGGLTVGANGPVLFKGPVTFSGTATYVLSTNTFWTDNILELHVPPTGVNGQWTVDDGKDIGLRFHYYTNSTDTNAALVLANDTKWLEWYSSGAENTSTFAGSSYGNFKTGGLWATQNMGVGYTAAQAGEKLGVNGGVYVNGIVTATTFVGNLTGTATNATNINGGAAGSLVYQSAPNTTALLPIGTNGYILTVAGGNPTWSSVSGLSAGNATTATNIAGGLKDQIPYQSAPGQTVFSSALTFNGTTFTTTNVVVSGTGNATGYNNGTGALQVKGGAAINNDLWVGGDINLQGSLFLKGVGLDQITGSTGTFDYVFIEGTGTGLTVYDSAKVLGSTAVFSTNSGAFQVIGGVGIGGSAYIGGNLTVTNNLTVGGVIISNGGISLNSGSFATNLGNNRMVYTNASGQLASTSTFTYDGTSFTVGANTTITGSLTVGGMIFSNGGITMGGSTNLVTNLGNNRVTYTNGSGNLASTSTFNFDGTNLVQTAGYTQLGLLTATTFTATSANIIGNLTVGGMIFSNGGLTMGTGTNIVTNLGTNRVVYTNASGNLASTSNWTFDGTNFALTGASLVTGNSTVTNNMYVGGISSATNFVYGYTAITAAAGTTVMSATATRYQRVTGSTTQIVQLPDATTLPLGTTFIIDNDATGNVTVNNAGTVLVDVLVPGAAGYFFLEANGTSAGTWGKYAFNPGAVNWGDAGLDMGSQWIQTTGNITATSIVITGSATLPANINMTNLTVTNLTVTNNETIGNNLSVGNLFTSTGAATFGATVGIAGVTTISNTIDSNATNNGALVVSGGVGVAKNLTVGSAITIGTASTQTVVNAYYSNNTLLSSYTSGFIQSNASINLDTFSATAYRTAKYLVQIVDGTKIHVEEILVFHDGTNVYMTEYGIATSQGELGTFDANLAAGTITVTFQANYTPTQMTIKLSRQTITL